MAKKPARKPSLTPAMQHQVRTEYGLGAGVIELAKKYDRSKSIISRLVNGISRDDEKLANNLAKINQEIGTRKEHEQHLILQRSEQIQKIKDGTIKGTDYIIKRTLEKLEGLSDDKVNFTELLQTQTVMTKAHAIAEPKALIENKITNNTQFNIVVEFVE
jgi:hypothetical protein